MSQRSRRRRVSELTCAVPRHAGQRSRHMERRNRGPFCWARSFGAALTEAADERKRKSQHTTPRRRRSPARRRRVNTYVVFHGSGWAAGRVQRSIFITTCWRVNVVVALISSSVSPRGQSQCIVLWHSYQDCKLNRATEVSWG